MKRIMSMTMAMVLLTSFFSFSLIAKASNISQSQQISQKKQLAQNKLTDMNQQLAQMSGEIEDKQAQIGKIKDHIKQLNEHIDQTEKRIQKRKTLLKERIKTIYINGGAINYIDVLMGSKSFGDFISRMSAIYVITRQEKKLLHQQKQDEEKLQNQKQQVNQSLKEAQKKLNDLQSLLDNIKSVIAKKQSKVKKLSNKEHQLKSLSYQPFHTNQSISDSSSGVSLPQGSLSGSISGVINYGRKWIGHSSYVFGGGRTSYDVNHGIFDCSSFVYWSFKSNGITLGNSGVPSTSTLKYMGKAVNPQNMQPGDLVFFDTYKKDGHVGIYMGGGKFIGDQTSSGVSIESMSNSYWKSHFKGNVRRIIG